MIRWLVKKIINEEKEFEDIVLNNRFSVLEYRIHVLQKDIMRLNKNRTEDSNNINVHLDTGEQIKLNVTNDKLNELYNDVSTGKSWVKLGDRGLVRREGIRFIETIEPLEETVYVDGMQMGFKKK
jgi:hypothetical protein